MNIQEQFLSGQYFKISEYGDIHKYEDEFKCITDRFGRYVASVDKIGRVYVKAFTYVLDKAVKVNIDLRKVIFIEEIKV